MSMTRQLWAAIIVSMLFALAGSLLTSFLGARDYITEQLAQKNIDNATSLALSLSQGDPDDTRTELAVAALFDSGHYELIRVADPRGKVIVERAARDRGPGAPEWFVRLLPIRAAPGTAQVSSGWKQYGTVTLVSESRFAYQSLWEIAGRMTLALLLSGLVAGYLGSLILRRLIPPLRAVVDQAVGITERRFTTIAPPRVTELARLATAMNTMVERLKAMFELEAARLEEVRRDANYDAVTHLANRGYFLGRVAACLNEEAAGGVLALARVANLAAINQRLGRAPTDEMLRAVAARIGEQVSGHAEAIAGRLGGADFAVLWPGRRDAAQAADALLASMLGEAPRFDLDPQHFAHVGALVIRPGMALPEALARADAVLAASEARGQSAASAARDEDRTRVQATSAEQWGALLRGAISRKWAKLQPFPVLDMQGGDAHWECPLRLQFAEGGEWQPAGRFLPIAERLSLTPGLDLLAVELAFGLLEGELSRAEVAINLSPQSVADAGFRASLAALVARHRASAGRLWLEVAEGGALLHLDAVAAACRELAPLGCRIGIEHFGREFGQIGRLHHLGLAYVKVDATYVRGLEANEGNQAFLRGLRSIASAIGLKLYAEGVTNEAEAGALAALGFDGMTGPGVVRRA